MNLSLKGNLKKNYSSTTVRQQQNQSSTNVLNILSFRT